MGDINGVGPEVLSKALSLPEASVRARLVIVGSTPVLDEVRRFLPTTPRIPIVASPEEARKHEISITDAGLEPPSYRPGALDAAAGRCAVEWVKVAVRWAIDKRVAAIVTCPINKEGIHRAGYTYSGHTELVAEMTGSSDYRMCLFAGNMRVVHITSHMSMRDAIAAVTTERIASSIRIGHDALVRLGLAHRRIAVAALNPHAGEAGAFGSEETDIILPAIEQCRARGIDCSGPHPADTVFRRMHDGAFDLVVSMYHDQGHTPVKLIAMDDGVNVTLGIPIVRTSVDHGTAYDIAGRGLAREHSLCAAIRLAAQFAAAKT